MIVCFWLLGWSQFPGNSIIIVTSVDTEVNQLESRELKQLYLQKKELFQGTPLTPLNLPRGHESRVAFERALFGPHFNSENYWLEQRFKAGERPPIKVQSEAHVLVVISRNTGYLGYVSQRLEKEALELGLKVIEIIQPRHD